MEDHVPHTDSYFLRSREIIKCNGDVEVTYADITKSKELLQYHPKVKLEDGVKEFISWYSQYYKERK